MTGDDPTNLTVVMLIASLVMALEDRFAGFAADFDEHHRRLLADPETWETVLATSRDRKKAGK